QLETSGLLARALRAAGVLVAELDPDAVGEVLDGLDEREPVDLLDERDDVAALAAPEAVPAPDAGAHVERRRALVVERAQALERADARRLERDVRGDDLVDPCAVADGFHVLASDQACHEASLCAADGRRGGPGAGSVTRSRTRRARRATRRTGARRRRASSPSRARSPCRGGPGRSSRRPSRAPRGPGPGRPRGGRPRGARGGAAGPTWGSRPRTSRTGAGATAATCPRRRRGPRRPHRAPGRRARAPRARAPRGRGPASTATSGLGRPARAG